MAGDQHDNGEDLVLISGSTWQKILHGTREGEHVRNFVLQQSHSLIINSLQ